MTNWLRACVWEGKVQTPPEVHHNPKEDSLSKLLLLAALSMLGALLFAPAALAQSASSSASADIKAGAADTVPLNPDGTCPEGFVSVNAPFCAEESPNTPGRIFGYGEGDLSSTSPPTASSEATACGAPGPEDAALSGEARLQREMDIRAGKIDVCPSASATASDTATASSTEASDSASARPSTSLSTTPTATATASGTAPASVAAAVGGSLPATGGHASPLMGIAALMLFAGGGIVSVAIVRRTY
jgi:hypothetical protein